MKQKHNCFWGYKLAPGVYQRSLIFFSWIDIVILCSKYVHYTTIFLTMKNTINFHVICKIINHFSFVHIVTIVNVYNKQWFQHYSLWPQASKYKITFTITLCLWLPSQFLIQFANFPAPYNAPNILDHSSMWDLDKGFTDVHKDTPQLHCPKKYILYFFKKINQIDWTRSPLNKTILLSLINLCLSKCRLILFLRNISIYFPATDIRLTGV